ncbi:MAG: hypothetical protein NZ822_02975 [Patescibacteria group bacterium]|nr:hypothetical protein [Patescibacteria group bacterium]
MTTLPFELKRIFLGIYLLVNLGLLIWIPFSSLNLINKFIFFFILICLFLGVLVIFEAVNSFLENLFFWLIIAIISAFFYWPSSIAILLLSILKILDNNHLYHSRLKFPFLELIFKNYVFLLVVALISGNIFIYQTFIKKNELPVSFSNYSLWLDNLNRITRINFPFDKPIAVLLEDYGKSRLKSDEISTLLSLVSLPKVTIKELSYQGLKENWSNEKTRFWFLIVFLFLINPFVYSVMIILGRFIALFTMLIINILKLVGLFRLETKSVNKEVIVF